jgi:hypothetical protein
VRLRRSVGDSIFGPWRVGRGTRDDPGDGLSIKSLSDSKKVQESKKSTSSHSYTR